MSKTDKERIYKGEGFTVGFRARRCIHVAECGRGLPEVFDVGRRPWVDTNGAALEKIIEVVSKCPSGALEVKDAEGNRLDRVPDTPEMTVVTDGPLKIRGRVKVQAASGSMDEVTRATLCRCGASKNKPFCDNSHFELGEWESAPDEKDDTV